MCMMCDKKKRINVKKYEEEGILDYIFSGLTEDNRFIFRKNSNGDFGGGELVISDPIDTCPMCGEKLV